MGQQQSQASEDCRHGFVPTYYQRPATSHTSAPSAPEPQSLAPTHQPLPPTTPPATLTPHSHSSAATQHELEDDLVQLDHQTADRPLPPITTVAGIPLSYFLPIATLSTIGVGAAIGLQLGFKRVEREQREIDDLVKQQKAAGTYREPHYPKDRDTPITAERRAWALRRSVLALGIATASVIGFAVISIGVMRYYYDIKTFREFGDACQQRIPQHTGEGSYVRSRVFRLNTNIQSSFGGTRVGQYLQRRRDEQLANEDPADEAAVVAVYDDIRRIEDEELAAERAAQEEQLEVER